MATAARQDEQQTGRLTLARSESVSATLGQRLVDSWSQSLVVPVVFLLCDEKWIASEDSSGYYSHIHMHPAPAPVWVCRRRRNRPGETVAPCGCCVLMHPSIQCCSKIIWYTQSLPQNEPLLLWPLKLCFPSLKIPCLEVKFDFHFCRSFHGLCCSVMTLYCLLKLLKAIVL